MRPTTANRIIYLDNNASTMPDPLVIAAVAEAMTELPANPSSSHAAGRNALEAIEDARKAVAWLVDASPREVIFTSGATESNNLAIRGLWDASRASHPERNRVIVGATEHPSVLEVAGFLERCGAEVVIGTVDKRGILDLERLYASLNDRTLLLAIMAANNETGVISPLRDVIAAAHAHQALVHCDATQAVGRIALSFRELAMDSLSLSAHKIHGPKGVGALVLQRSVSIAEQTRGGGHEYGLRAGTLNSSGIVGFGVAATLAAHRLPESARIGELRDLLVSKLQSVLDGVELNGLGAICLPNTANLRFVGADAEAIMAGAPTVACSTGSACSSAYPTPSPVLLAMGLSNEAAAESLRFSLSRNTTEPDILEAVDHIAESVAHVREMTGAMTE